MTGSILPYKDAGHFLSVFYFSETTRRALIKLGMIDHHYEVSVISGWRRHDDVECSM